jgi:glutamine synthetase
MPHIYEYIWRDINGKFRSKTRVSDDVPTIWNYDGSSTGQANTHNSEIELIPVKIVKDPFRENSKLVLCETTAHNDTRSKAKEIFKHHVHQNPMFGFEQEFFMILTETNAPLGWNHKAVHQLPQKEFYCGVGSIQVHKSRVFLDDVLKKCLEAGLSITGYNYEVAIGQAEFQVCDIGIDAADQLMLLRYILERTGELYGIMIDYHCKALGTEWNGSGLHTNFSTLIMRSLEDPSDRLKELLSAIEKLRDKHEEAIENYGHNNYLRLTGIHETSNINKFTYGIADRSASIRIPRLTENQKYIEDRRPASDADPYYVSSFIFKTVCF